MCVKVLDESWQVRLVEELKGRVLDCVADQSGNHVIQKCIECIKPTSRIAFVIQVSTGSPLLHVRVRVSVCFYSCLPVLACARAPVYV